jgi:putative FmdB family regulatory protein
MPIFEYRCSKCNTKFEVLHKSIQAIEEVICPNCNSNNIKKLLSTFSASVNSRSGNPGFCSMDGASCPNASHGCGGMCGLE